MSDELDPEVIADLQLRAATEQDATRTRIAGAAIGTWRPDAPVTEWPCRHPQCSQLVGVMQDAVDHLTTCNRWLRDRGEREIPVDAVVLCAEHVAIKKRLLEERHAEQRVETRELVQRMKASPSPRNEHETIKRLTDLRHPDVPGLIESLAAKLETGRNKKAKGSRL